MQLPNLRVWVRLHVRFGCSRRSANAVVQALADAKPDAIFSSLFAADLHKFVAA
jgi:hypothetical protein